MRKRLMSRVELCQTASKDEQNKLITKPIDVFTCMIHDSDDKPYNAL